MPVEIESGGGLANENCIDVHRPTHLAHPSRSRKFTNQGRCEFQWTAWWAGRRARLSSPSAGPKSGASSSTSTVRPPRGSFPRRFAELYRPRPTARSHALIRQPERWPLVDTMKTWLDAGPGASRSNPLARAICFALRHWGRASLKTGVFKSLRTPLSAPSAPVKTGVMKHLMAGLMAGPKAARSSRR